MDDAKQIRLIKTLNTFEKDLFRHYSGAMSLEYFNGIWGDKKTNKEVAEASDKLIRIGLVEVDSSKNLTANDIVSQIDSLNSFEKAVLFLSVHKMTLEEFDEKFSNATIYDVEQVRIKLVKLGLL